MKHTHYGYGYDEKAKRITHDHTCRKPDDHNHPDEFRAIYWDEEGGPTNTLNIDRTREHP